jgi:hypothetical protein
MFARSCAAEALGRDHYMHSFDPKVPFFLWALNDCAWTDLKLFRMYERVTKDIPLPFSSHTSLHTHPLPSL